MCVVAMVLVVTTDRLTGRQMDRQTDRQTGRQAARQIQRECSRHWELTLRSVAGARGMAVNPLLRNSTLWLPAGTVQGGGTARLRPFVTNIGSLCSVVAPSKLAVWVRAVTPATVMAACLRQPADDTSAVAPLRCSDDEYD